QRDIHTITLRYDEFSNTSSDEAPLAGQLAAQYGSRHTTRTISEAEFRADLPRIFDAMDQPTIDGINTWFISKAARELGLKAVISGLGCDELFGGYPSFNDIPRWVRLGAVPAYIPFLGDAFRHLLSASGLLPSLMHPKAAGWFKYGGSYAGAYLLRRGVFLPWELGKMLDRGLMAEGLRRLDPLRLIAAAVLPRPRTAIGKVASLEAGLYLRNQLLRDTDWASMAHSLEVRVPLVDVRLLTAIAQSGGGRVVVVPRQGKAPSAALPVGVRQLGAPATKPGYVLATARVSLAEGRFDAIFCGHLHLAPLAAIVAGLLRLPLWLQLHGAEAWEPLARGRLWAAWRATLITAVSRHTRRRFLQLTGIEPSRVRVLPNTVGEG